MPLYKLLMYFLASSFSGSIWIELNHTLKLAFEFVPEDIEQLDIRCLINSI